MQKITKRKYTTNLTTEEINVINSLKDNYEIFTKTKLNMMSVLSYLIKHGATSNNGLRKSIKDIWNMYRRYHTDIKTISNFKKIIYKLEQVKLIFIEKIGKVNIYHARKFLQVTQEVSKEVTKENTFESVDIPTIEQDSQNTQIQKLNKDYINITYNTPEGLSVNSYKNSLPYQKACIQNNQDTLEPNELIMMAKQILKVKKRRSRKMLAMVISKLYNKRHIVRINAVRYLETVISDCIAKYEFNREMYAYAIVKNKNNYRLAYNRVNSNFTQRKYDCDKLEAQLLGWDDSNDDDYEIK
nr:MAG TPA: hypothetical protein [Caudoviricetes sp.]